MNLEEGMSINKEVFYRGKRFKLFIFIVLVIMSLEKLTILLKSRTSFIK